MDICITELQSKDTLDFILPLSCLSGLADEHVGVGCVTWTQLDVCSPLLKCQWWFLCP